MATAFMVLFACFGNIHGLCWHVPGVCHKGEEENDFECFHRFFFRELRHSQGAIGLGLATPQHAWPSLRFPVVVGVCPWVFYKMPRQPMVGNG